MAPRKKDLKPTVRPLENIDKTHMMMEDWQITTEPLS